MRGLFLEGLIFGGAYLRREICVSKSIGLAFWLEVNLPFLLCFTLYLREIFQVQAPGGLYLEGWFNGGFFALPVWGGLYLEGLIHGGAYFRNFTVSPFQDCEWPRMFRVLGANQNGQKLLPTYLPKNVHIRTCMGHKVRHDLIRYWNFAFMLTMKTDNTGIYQEKKRDLLRTLFSQFLSWEAYLLSQRQLKNGEYCFYQLLKKEKRNAIFTVVMERIWHHSFWWQDFQFQGLVRTCLMLLPVPAIRVLLAPGAKWTLMIVLQPAVEMVSSFLISSCNFSLT